MQQSIPILAGQIWHVVWQRDYYAPRLHSHLHVDPPMHILLSAQCMSRVHCTAQMLHALAKQ